MVKEMLNQPEKFNPDENTPIEDLFDRSAPTLERIVGEYGVELPRKWGKVRHMDRAEFVKAVLEKEITAETQKAEAEAAERPRSWWYDTGNEQTR